MAPRRAPVPLTSSDLMSAPRRGVVLTDPAGRPYVAPFPEDGSGVLGGDGTFQPSSSLTPSPTVADLDGTADAGASADYSRGDHRHADANRPTDDEKAALVGSYGTPDGTNPYVTDTDPRLVSGAGPAQNTFLVSGGQITWVSGYDFIVSAAIYYILGVLHSSPQTPITLTAADPTDDRVDVIAVDNTGTVVVIAGTPGPQPAEPDVDPATQLKLAIVLVDAASTAPSGASAVVVYAENAGGPGEWNWSSSGAGWALGSTNNPRTGTKDIEATNVSSAAYVQAQIASGTFDPNLYAQLVLYIRPKAAWANNRTLQVRLQNAGVVVGATLTITNGQFGFDSATLSYQQVAIPISQFAVTAGAVITQVRITRQGPSTIGFYLDDVAFIATGTVVSGGGLTQEQADARYAPLGPSFVTVSAEAGLPNERRLVAGSGISVTDGGAGSTVTIAATGGGGTGDVVGPASAVDDRLATFDGTTGKLIQDGGKTIATVLSDADAAADAGDAVTLAAAEAYTDSELAAHVAIDDAHFGVKHSIALDADDAQLVNDTASPGNNKVYGTDGSGVRGWKADPSGGSGITQLTSDVTAGPGSGSVAATIAANAVTDAKFRQSAARSVVGTAGAATANVADITAGTDKQVLRRSGTSIGFGAVDLASADAVTGTLAAGNLSTQAKTRVVTFIIGDGVTVITTGIKAYTACPYTGTITGARLLSTDPAATSCSIVLGVTKDSIAGTYPPTTSIVASAPPTLTTGTNANDTTLTGWSTAVSAGDAFGVSVTSVTAAKQVQLQITIVLS